MQNRNSLENCLKLGEYKRMLQAAKEMNNCSYYVMRALASTGVRISELEYFTVDAVKNGGCTIYNKGKVRNIFIPSGVCRELLSYCSQKKIAEGLVFTARDPQKVINEFTVLRWLKAIAIRAGVDPAKAFPHNLRHLFAVKFMDGYNDLAELADILGHSRIETTRIYTRTSMEEKRIKIENLNL